MEFRSAKLPCSPLTVSAIASASELVKESIVTKSDLLVTREEGLELYEDMVLGRSFEDMCAQMYYRGRC